MKSIQISIQLTNIADICRSVDKIYFLDKGNLQLSTIYSMKAEHEVKILITSHHLRKI